MSCEEELIANLPLKVIHIATPGDLTVEIVEYEYERVVSVQNSDDEGDLGSVKTISKPKARASFTVDKSRLEASGEYFSAMFGGPWKESKSSLIPLQHDAIKGMQIWFSALHLAPKLPFPYASVPVEEVWHMIKASNKYDFDRKIMKQWFARWFAEKWKDAKDDLDICRQLLFPCYFFNFAPGFQKTTKMLVYEAESQISESNPTAHHQMHLPPRVMQQLRNARGSLRNKLYQKVFHSIENIIDSKCACKERTVFDYFCELRRIDVFSLYESTARKSIQEFLDKMEDFDGTNMRSDKKDCYLCKRDWGYVVEAARKEIAEKFDGLCLTCMDSTLNLREGGDQHDDYWIHGRRMKYDLGCGIKHGQPTWYFSFMGRRESRQFD